MAKGDDSRARNRIDSERGEAGNRLNNLWAQFGDQNAQGLDRYNNAANQAGVDYGNIMNKYQGFADTGGFSPQDESAIRARAVSPTRAVYSNAMRNVERQKAIQGGFSPGYGTLMSRFAREGSQAASDANTNAEASIAEMKQRGKLAGVSGMAQAYGTTPGQASLYGSMSNQASDRLAGLQGYQNQLGLGTMNSQIAAAQLPGKWENTVGRIGDVFKIGGQLAGIPNIWGGGGGLQMPPGPSNSTILGPRP